NIPQYDTPRDIQLSVMDNCSGEIKTFELYENVNNLYATWGGIVYLHAKDSYNYSAGNYTATLKVSHSSDPNYYDIIHQQFSIFSESVKPIAKMGDLEFFNCGVKASEYNATDNISLTYATLNLLDKTTNEIQEIRKWDYLYRTEWRYIGTSISCSDLVIGREYDLILTAVDASGNEANNTKTFVAPESMFKPVVYLDSLSTTIPYGTTQESVILQAYDTDLESMTFSVTKEETSELLMQEQWLGGSFNKRYYIQTQNYSVGKYTATLIANDQAGYSTEVNQSFEVVPIELDPPEYIRASRTYTDRVETSWKAINGATKYYIYRCVTSDTVPDNNFTLVSISNDANYTDTDVDVHYRYFYKVKSYSVSSGLSEFSDYNKGYIILKAPTNVQAIDNIASDRIRVTWDSVEHANLYYIFRATSIDGSYSYLEHTSDSYHDDTSISSGVTYYYKVWAEIDGVSRAISNYSEPSNEYTQTTILVPTINSINPSSGYELDQFNFSVSLSSLLPNGYEVYLNFDDREGGWLSQNDENGYIKMSCNGTDCTLTIPMKHSGSRQARAVLVKDNTIQNESYSSLKTFTINTLSYYQLQNRNSSKCLDSYWGGTTDGTKIIQYTCTNADSLQWSLKDIGSGNYFIVNNKSKKCIKVPNDSMDDGTQLELGECSYSDTSTMWQREGRLLRSSMSEKCLDVYYALKDDFTNIIQYSCNSTSRSMQWSLY
ncbi:MAG: RICIN domain-containing protein, partial [Campylobacterota bacterium]|nr:RICIN domain-containing protein [Campylobacterota bacterium]